MHLQTKFHKILDQRLFFTGHNFFITVTTYDSLFNRRDLQVVGYQNHADLSTVNKIRVFYHSFFGAPFQLEALNPLQHLQWILYFIFSGFYIALIQCYGQSTSVPINI